METSRLLILLLIMLLLVSVCVACAQTPPDEPSLDDFMISSTTTLPPTAMVKPPTPTITPTATPIPPERFTGVILGSDFDPLRPERVRFGVRSDTFMIYTGLILPDHGIIDLRLISLPRDLWIPVPCSPLDPQLEGNDRINAAYAYGQFECVAETMAGLGMPVNAPIFYTEFRDFIMLIDNLGPIPITPLVTYTDWCGHFQGTEGIGAWRTWWEGNEYLMDGGEALCYARARAGASDGDIDRTRRALELMMAMLDYYPSVIFDSDNRLDAVAELLGTWQWASQYIDTDMSLDQIYEYGGYGIDLMNNDIPITVHRMTLDEVEFYRTPIYNASVLKPKVDVNAWLQCRLQWYEGPEPCLEQTLLEEE